MIDLDGTLVESERAWLSTFLKVYKELSSLSGLDVNEIINIIRSYRFKLIRVSDPRAFDWDYILRTVSSKLGVRTDFYIEEEAPRIAQETKLVKGAIETLKQLRQLGFKIIIGTNGNWKYQRYILNHHRLIDIVNEIRTSDMVGCLKNNPRFFKGIDISVGDHIVFDVHYPRIFGLKAILIGNFRKHLTTAKLLGIDKLEKPSIAIRSIHELPRAICSILGT